MTILTLFLTPKGICGHTNEFSFIEIFDTFFRIEACVPYQGKQTHFQSRPINIEKNLYDGDIEPSFDPKRYFLTSILIKIRLLSIQT